MRAKSPQAGHKRSSAEPFSSPNLNNTLLLALVLLVLVAVAALFFFDKLVPVPFVSSACPDSTPDGECSSERPLFCADGVLVERPDVCGCPAGFDYAGGVCNLVIVCGDGTEDGKCSVTKPLKCVNGTLSYRASVCGCPDGYQAAGERCVVRMQETYLSEYAWDHMPVSYSVDEKSCGSYESRKIRRAFAEIENASVVLFEEVSESADIEVGCVLLENCYEQRTDIQDYVTYRYESICSHKKGVAQTTYLGERILSAKITMVGLAGFSETTGKGPSGFYVGSCGHTTTEVHEILHAFGYGHKESNQSIMYFEEDGVPLTLQKSGDCIGSKKQIDADIIADLAKRYG